MFKMRALHSYLSLEDGAYNRELNILKCRRHIAVQMQFGYSVAVFFYFYYYVQYYTGEYSRTLLTQVHMGLFGSPCPLENLLTNIVEVFLCYLLILLQYKLVHFRPLHECLHNVVNK